MEKKDKLDFLFKFIALLGAAFSFFWGIQNYNQINKDESAKAFWNQQFPIYKELCNSASTIATSDDSLAVKKAKNDFWRMYYGDARMVVDWQVHQKMSSYASLLKDIDRGFKDKDELIFASFDLATQCRKSLADSWNISLSELDQQ
ncbi:hypothetical protein D3C87_218090 [compost metagenome]